MKFFNNFKFLALFCIISCAVTLRIKNSELLESEYNTVNYYIYFKSLIIDSKNRRY